MADTHPEFMVSPAAMIVREMHIESSNTGIGAKKRMEDIFNLGSSLKDF